jgi:membrane associated rhomboid family serine protease
MGIYDRDYYRDGRSRSSFGTMQMWSITTWIIAINVAVFVIDRAMGRRYLLGEIIDGQAVAVSGPMGRLELWGHFSVGNAIFKLQVWRFLTFQFQHANFQHLLFNMIALFFFGPLVEAYLGRRRYLAFYLLSGCAGPVAYMLLWVARTHLIGSPYVPLVGASAGIFGVLIAAARIAPDATVLIYGILPMRLRAMAWVMLIVAAYTVFTYGPNAGGEAAHLGGAAAGFGLIRNPQLLDVFDSARSRWQRRRYQL